MPGRLPPDPSKVFFKSRDLRLAGHLYVPLPGAPDRRGAAIIIGHPWTSVKEQSPADYARVLTTAGFVCLTFDAAYQGESEGRPRNLEDPAQRTEDIKSAVTYLYSRDDVVEGRKIGVLGICASGGYAAHAAQTDLRIRAVAMTAAVCVGTMARRGFEQDVSNPTILNARLEVAYRDRNSDFDGRTVGVVHMLPEVYDPNNPPEDLPASFRDLASYYRTPRAKHPRAAHTCMPRSWDLMANFDAFAFNGMISPRPLLAITGSKAVTKWFSDIAVERAGQPSELYVIDGLTHADMYDHVDVAGVKLVDFFERYLV